MNKLLKIKTGDLLTIAGRMFMVQEMQGSGWSMQLTLTTNKLFAGSDGRLTNRLKCTLEELLERLIIVHPHVDKTV